MPLRLSTAGQVFFWIFLTLFVAAAVCSLVFCFLGKGKKTAFFVCAALFLLGVMLVCLVPKYPLIYCSCFLAAAAVLGQVFERHLWKLLFLLLSAAGQGLAIVQICAFYSVELPAAPVAVILPPLLVLLIERGAYLLKKRESIPALQLAELLSDASAAVFAVILLANQFYYAGILLVAGYLYLLGEAAFPARPGGGFRRSLFKTGFFLLGSFLLYLGLVLCVTA